MTTCDVTLAIPTHNGGPWFRALLLRCAELEPRPAAFSVIDSSSHDGTAEAARAAGFAVRVIPIEEFDHGRTRQHLAEAATTRFVAFLTQDALPRRDYLAPLLAALEDERTAAACARVVPRAEASALASRSVLEAEAAGSTPRLAECAPEVFSSLSLGDRRRLLWLDDVASLIRREVLLRHPFPSTMMGEDVAFAEAAIAAGYRVRFVPESVVEHSHEYSAQEAYRRYRADAEFQRIRFGLRVRPSLSSVVRGVAFEVIRDWRYIARGCHARAILEALRSPWLRTWQVLGQWRGSTGAESL